MVILLLQLIYVVINFCIVNTLKMLSRATLHAMRQERNERMYFNGNGVS